MDENTKEFLASLSALTRKHKIKIVGTYDGSEIDTLVDYEVTPDSKYVVYDEILIWSKRGD